MWAVSWSFGMMAYCKRLQLSPNLTPLPPRKCLHHIETCPMYIWEDTKELGWKLSPPISIHGVFPLTSGCNIVFWSFIMRAYCTKLHFIFNSNIYHSPHNVWIAFIMGLDMIEGGGGGAVTLFKAVLLVYFHPQLPFLIILTYLPHPTIHGSPWNLV